MDIRINLLIIIVALHENSICHLHTAMLQLHVCYRFFLVIMLVPVTFDKLIGMEGRKIKYFGITCHKYLN
jgi:hypothetical protein